MSNNQKIENKLIEACEPIIVHLENLTERRIRYEADQIAKVLADAVSVSPDMKYQAWEANYRKENRRADLSFLYMIRPKVSRGSYYDEYESRVSEMAVSQEVLSCKIDSEKKFCREFNLLKLRDAVHRYCVDIFNDVSGIKVDVGAKGCEVRAKLHAADGLWHFETKAISAGGYNIQCFHYRYLIDVVSPSGDKQIILNHVTAKEKAEKDAKRVARNKDQANKKFIVAAKKIATFVLSAKKEGCNYDKVMEIVRQFPAKRKDIMEAVVSGECPMSMFDDLMIECNRGKAEFERKVDGNSYGLGYDLRGVFYAIRDYREVASR